MKKSTMGIFSCIYSLISAVLLTNNSYETKNEIKRVNKHEIVPCGVHGETAVFTLLETKIRMKTD